MSNNFDNLRGAWQRLSPELQDAFARTIQVAAGQAAVPAVAAAAVDSAWLRICDCAKWGNVDKSTVSRAADSGYIVDNGKNGPDRRISLTSFFHWKVKRDSEHQEHAPPPPPPTTEPLSPREQRTERLRIKYMGDNADDSVAESLQ